MKRKLIACAVAAALALSALAGYALGRLTASEAQTALAPAASGPSADSIEQFRTEREQLRQMQLSQLNEIVYGEGTTEALAAQARQRQLELMAWAEQEQTIENVLRARGFTDALVTVHTSSVNVLVRADALTREQSAVILELVMRETGVSGGNVKIIPVN